MGDKWVGAEPALDSPYYPYRKTTEGSTLAGAEVLPYLLTRYLMDLPLAGYAPPAGNEFPRARLKRLLYWDGPDALSKPLPTTEQMRNLVFDPQNPDNPPNKQKGYRIFPQKTVAQAQTAAQSILRVYLGNATPNSRGGNFVVGQTVVYEILTSYALESNLQDLPSRSYAILQAIQEATVGVSFGGIGGVEPGFISEIGDQRMNVGYRMLQHIDWEGSAPSYIYAEQP